MENPPFVDDEVTYKKGWFSSSQTVELPEGLPPKRIDIPE